ncbi:MAG: 50S ribosomal protein L9 [Clostridiales bacterium]|nr:50S ribosomal protein L9 [Clostridiales bacterium]
MKVILIKELKGKGKAGDIIDVNPNYASNVLIKQGIAKEANASNLNDHKGQQEAKVFHHGEMVKSYQALADKIKNKIYHFTLNVGANGKAFGSITKQEIVNALAQDNIKIEKNQIKDFPSIKSVGQYKITLQLIKEVSVDIFANVNIK